MGKRGPRKQPTSIRMARGNPGKRPINGREPIPPAGDIEPPSYLSGLSLDKWNEVVPKLRAMRVVTTADVDPLARYCAMHEQWVKYNEQMRRGLDVVLVRDKDGKIKYMQSSPAATMFVKLSASMLRIEQEFGLTPSARASMEVHSASQEDDAEAALLKRLAIHSA